ncbi:hypothetical protein NX868_19425 [Burkholderia thailandensis]|uniref:Uncharacterized protein n=1 Tax=Burkholderia phage phiE255 TaxID=2883942 RepID=A4JWM0_9CAUD|nr:hypothetical protein [Burkholderia thailandensis]YP_001111228.1 gp28, hypothetical protein [Burkholderia phage phiE255]ABO60649.1 gp28, hypothetical protein [Burkholderia phage phiE255]MCS6455067.1 hypothetical protein [Burkholderia thailandensis]MCS6484439.1 hypothetical protein [Burkholderia thailandensis]MDW9236400.1 hypothetical protein [Burkholderia thailandensis]
MGAKMLLPAKQPGRNGYKYKPQFGIVVICRNETDQQAIYHVLRKQGYKLKVVCV